VLDGPQSVTALKRIRHWIDQGWTRLVFNRNDDFDKGKTALAWSGHWKYPVYLKALGKDLILLPLPDFGRGIKTGMGSWNWGITNNCGEPAGAWSFPSHLMSPREILRVT
jgi:multiple sugar transport system substrate-binding protein